MPFDLFLSAALFTKNEANLTTNESLDFVLAWVFAVWRTGTSSTTTSSKIVAVASDFVWGAGVSDFVWGACTSILFAKLGVSSSTYSSPSPSSPQPSSGWVSGSGAWVASGSFEGWVSGSGAWVASG